MTTALSRSREFGREGTLEGKWEKPRRSGSFLRARNGPGEQARRIFENRYGMVRYGMRTPNPASFLIRFL